MCLCHAPPPAQASVLFIFWSAFSLNEGLGGCTGSTGVLYLWAVVLSQSTAYMLFIGYCFTASMKNSLLDPHDVGLVLFLWAVAVNALITIVVMTICTSVFNAALRPSPLQRLHGFWKFGSPLKALI